MHQWLSPPSPANTVRTMSFRTNLHEIVFGRKAFSTLGAAGADGSAKIMNPFLLLWQSYSKSLQRRPLPTKMAAAVLIFTTSDLATQYITRDDDYSAGSKRRRNDDQQVEDSAPFSVHEFNIQRTLSASSFGVVGTIYLHHWWNFLERFVNARFPISQAKTSSRITNTLVKVVIDQAVSAPLYNWTYFFVTNAVHSNNSNIGERVDAAAGKATAMVGPLMLDHWKIWPVIHSANFYFTPVQNRVLVQNLVLVGWSGYLSHLNHGRGADEEVVVLEEEDAAIQEEQERDMTPKKTKVVRLKRRKTIITGIDVAEVEVEESNAS